VQHIEKWSKCTVWLSLYKNTWTGIWENRGVVADSKSFYQLRTRLRRKDKFTFPPILFRGKTPTGPFGANIRVYVGYYSVQMLLPPRNVRQDYCLNAPIFRLLVLLNHNLRMKRSMEFWCNDREKGKQKFWEKNLSQYPFFDHRFYIHNRTWTSAVNGRRISPLAMTKTLTTIINLSYTQIFSSNHCASIRKKSWLILCMDIMAVYWE